MGLFNFLKKQKNEENENNTKLKIIGIDNVYLIDIPEDWVQYESDRFRTINKTKTINFSITNYGKPLDKTNPFTLNELQTETFALFQRFVNEGGYDPIDDRETNNNYVYQAFKVDHETQYYYYTSREGIGQLIRIALILKEKGVYKSSTKKLLLEIGNSIKTKIS